MDLSNKKLIDLIPRDELRERFADPCCELEADFLCFEELYRAAAKVVPKDYAIVDLGCYMGAQSYFFGEHRLYIGVDSYDALESYDGYVPPGRFKGAGNVRHVSSDIRAYLTQIRSQESSLKKVYALVSYVPQYENFLEDALKAFPNLAFCYCKESGFFGEFKDEMQAEFLRLRNAGWPCV